LEIGRWNTELLYNFSLAAGIGSNDIGLDRGQLGREAVVTFERVGPKALLVEQNYGYRAVTGDAAEQEAVKESFARSVLWGFAVVAEQDGRALVDATEFFLRDAHGVADQLKDSDQGTYKVEASRSALYLPHTKNFPKNTEVEATLTFTGGPAGGLLRSVSPSNDAVTVRQHHSFVELPGPGYTPRAFDPRGGYFGVSYFDFSTPMPGLATAEGEKPRRGGQLPVAIFLPAVCGSIPALRPGLPFRFRAKSAVHFALGSSFAFFQFHFPPKAVGLYSLLWWYCQDAPGELRQKFCYPRRD
jgi:hypothetical protein